MVDIVQHTVVYIQDKTRNSLIIILQTCAYMEMEMEMVM